MSTAFLIAESRSKENVYTAKIHAGKTNFKTKKIVNAKHVRQLVSMAAPVNPALKPTVDNALRDMDITKAKIQ